MQEHELAYLWTLLFQDCTGWKKVYKMCKMAEAGNSSCPELGVGQLRHDQGLSPLK